MLPACNTSDACQAGPLQLASIKTLSHWMAVVNDLAQTSSLKRFKIFEVTVLHAELQITFQSRAAHKHACLTVQATT
jgi:hypothetical protein